MTNQLVALIHQNKPVLTSNSIAQFAGLNPAQFNDQLLSYSHLTGPLTPSVEGSYYLDKSQLSAIFEAFQKDKEKYRNLFNQFYEALDKAEQGHLNPIPKVDQPNSVKESHGQIIVRKFLNQDIQFEIINGQVMANATQMAKVFKREMKHYFEDPGRCKYVQHLYCKLYNTDVTISTSDSISTVSRKYPELFVLFKGFKKNRVLGFIRS